VWQPTEGKSTWSGQTENVEKIVGGEGERSQEAVRAHPREQM
jgi:hypothetical protein